MTSIVILGASTRAAATSARRAGLTPWCADLFADADLEHIATVRKISPDTYPHGLLDSLKEAPPGPVMYTGALENYPELIAKIDRPLWGNSANVLRAVRSPSEWTACFQASALPCPAIADEPTSEGRWLLKPRKSAAGCGIREYAAQAFDAQTHFLQERIDGIPCSAVFHASNAGVIFLGATEQLIGTPWLNASGFHYAGSIGPLFLGAQVVQSWRDLGVALGAAFHLRGLFGVDAILRDGVPWAIEINPRYTASVEILERSCRKPLLLGTSGTARPWFSGEKLGKAILFARATFAFPAEGPWLDALKDGVEINETEYADIPHAGEIIERGRPVLTIFASAPFVEDCRAKLQEKAQALDRRLWG